MITELKFTAKVPKDERLLEAALRSEDLIFVIQEMFDLLEVQLKLGKDLPEDARAYLQKIQMQYLALARKLEVHHMVFPA